MRPRLSVVIPHWPLDEEVDQALRTCLASLPADCEKIVVVNPGTGFAVNVNLGLRIATGDYVAVVTNDTEVLDGNVYDLCLPGIVTSPAVLEKPGIEPGGFHGAFWVAPREVLERIGPLDERFEGAFYEDDDYLERLRRAAIPTRQIASVRVRSRRVGLTMSKLSDRGERWLVSNERRFADKWGWTPPPVDP
jgi:glycosyltransferase involved in cell wall biosynthesis